MNKHSWLKVVIKLLPCLVLLADGLIFSFAYGSVRRGTLEHRLLALSGVILFLVFAIMFLHILTKAIRNSIIAHQLGVGRAAGLRFILGLIGYLVIAFTTLDRLGIPIGHILLGSAVLGIILGVAAQQALGNIFASIALIVSHPFSVGDNVTLFSGALGGKYTGTIAEIGLTHTVLQQADGSLVSLPNSSILSSTAIMPLRHKKT
jgi:small-conductance mechanosensitive channel